MSSASAETALVLPGGGARAAYQVGALRAIRAPTLLLRGAKSDLLSPGTAAEMTRRGPKPELLEFPDVGHAPMLLSAEQVEPLLRFIRA